MKHRGRPGESEGGTGLAPALRGGSRIAAGAARPRCARFPTGRAIDRSLREAVPAGGSRAQEPRPRAGRSER